MGGGSGRKGEEERDRREGGAAGLRRRQLEHRNRAAERGRGSTHLGSDESELWLMKSARRVISGQAEEVGRRTRSELGDALACVCCMSVGGEKEASVPLG